MLYWIGVIIFILFIYRKVHGFEGFTFNEKEPIFGVYREHGSSYPFKMAFIYLLLTFRKLWSLTKVQNISDTDVKQDIKPGTAGGYGVKSRSSPELMDCTQPLSAHPKAIDAVYFNGASKDGWNFIGATARRPRGVVNGFLYIRVPKIGLLVAPKLPDTMMFQSHPAEGYSAEGLEFKPFQPMASWTIKYDGLLRVEKPATKKYESGQLVKVQLDAIWSSALEPFDFDTDMSPLTVARSMASQPWSKDYFKLLKEMHQTHYEQYGELSGTLKVEDEEFKMNKIDTVRDHSYGEKREWKHFHRYALHYIALESGAKIAVGVVSMPVVFSSMEIGYIYDAEGNLYPITGHTFKLHEHGEGGNPPTDYAFSFTADGETYHVKVQATDTSTLYIGWEWEARIVENFCQFEVNGIKGWGCAEFCYRHLQGRPKSYAQNDPAWADDILKG